MTARQGQCVRYGLLQGILAFFVLLAAAIPGALRAAPFADYVIDARTGEVLHEKNADTRLHPASLTKMMTLYIAFEAIERGEVSLDTMVTVSQHAASQPPSRLGLRAGQKIALRYLIRAAAIKSANDAATAIGEAIEGSEPAFAKRMNRTAKALGMTRTSFRNANGLTAEGHLSTAHDMTTLGRRLFFDYPQYYNLFSRRTADAGMTQVRSTNSRFLDSYEGADGIKTGYTGPAGFNLVASAQRGNKRIIATVFGGTSTAQRNAKVAELLDLGFGRAPNRATVQKPMPPTYLADATDADDALARAVAADVAEDAAGGAAKTIRVTGQIQKSPRPKGRPEPAAPAAATEEPMLLAQAPSAGAPPEAAADKPLTEEAIAGLSDSVAAALAEVATTPEFAQTTAPQPETLALAAAAPPAPGSAAESAVTEMDTATPELEGKRPQPRPAGAAPASAQVALAEAEPDPAASASPVSEEIELADASPTAESPPGNLAPVAVTELVAPTVAAPAPPASAAGASAKTIRPAPEPRADQIILTSAEPTGPALPLEQEVISRVSTSGGREFGISLGKYPSRYEAERILLQTALVEIGTLDEALRKVVNRKGGFDATFVGLTGDMAELACRRLAARNAPCTVIGP